MEIGEVFIKIGLRLFDANSLDQLKNSIAELGKKASETVAEFEKMRMVNFDVQESNNRLQESNNKLEESQNNVDSGIKRNSKTLGNFISQLNVYRLGILGVVYAMTKLAEQTLNSSINLDRMSRRLDMPIQSLQRWQIAGKKAGAEVDSVFDNIKKVQDDFKNGRASNISVWQFLGIDISRQKPEEVMKQLVDKLQSVNVADRSALLERLGLDGKNINLGDIDFKLGRVDNLIKSDDEIKKVKELNKVFNDARISLALLRDRFISFATPIKYFFELITRLATGIDNIVKKTAGWEKVATILSGIVIFMTAKLHPLWAKLGLLALVIDDIITYFEGGESVLGKFIDWLKEANPLVKVLVGSLITLGATLTTLLTLNKIETWATGFIKAITGVGGAVKGLESSIASTSQSLMGLITSPASPFQIIAGGIGAIGTGYMAGKLIGDYGKKHSGEGGWSDKVGDWLLDIKNGDKNLLPSKTNNSRTHNNNITNNITINSDQPPREIARQTTETMQRQINMSIIPASGN
jgi:hypothetical protein